ncbi:hypothetical protein [Pedobacter sp. MC2016-24]|uniref:hypothetical protein n=1 Tax=Pedobacter sp. MC2016-24 TaxID=2780090 RepID=UPI001880DA81|nr:hypothetical protein [Pedobacter sp. MC2016-24]MBE9601380.1 hypothetical protein [Pedobacter sp. MC2016-24]
MEKINKQRVRNWIMAIVTVVTVNVTVSAQGERYVTIFYAVWSNETIQRSLYGSDVYNMASTAYSPYPQFNWWGKPAYAASHGDGTIKNNYLMYLNNDPEQPNTGLIDYHADLLSQAGVDFITLDLTNGAQQHIVNGAKALCLRYQWRIAHQYPTPKIVCWVLDEATLKAVEKQIFEVYDEEIFFNYLGKKLLLIAKPDTALIQGDSKQPAVPVNGRFRHYSSRHCWGLSAVKGSCWSFKSNTAIPPPAFYYEGKPEQMAAAVATQSTYMTTDGINADQEAIGRQKGAFFNTYMEAAKTVQPTFLFIHSWNEWAAQNLGSQAAPHFTDLWKTEYSADIEPMSGGHGDQYYQLMKTKIGEFKRAGRPGWEFLSDMEGWTAVRQVTGLHWQAGGYLSGNTSGASAVIQSNDNLSIKLSGKRYLSIRMKHNSRVKRVKISFITDADREWGQLKSREFAVRPNTSFTGYQIDMSGQPGWNGILRRIRIQLSNGSAATGHFQIDRIRIHNKKNS